MTVDASLANGAPIASRQINVDAAFVQKYQVIRLLFQAGSAPVCTFFPHSVALRTSQRGRKQLLNDEDKQHIRQCIDETPDITLAELRTKLGLKASIQTLSRVVRAMGYRVKKKSMSASEQERPRCTNGICRHTAPI